MNYRMAIASVALMLLGTLGASAQSQDDQNACMGDAFSVCGHAIPDRSRVAACLADNMGRLSPACRSVMARYNQPPGRANRYANERRSTPYRERYDDGRGNYWDSSAQRMERRSYDGRGAWAERDDWRMR